ncbi:MAG TPA: hypothetical protein VF792_06395 [Ktedonobacterales bacterium]
MLTYWFTPVAAWLPLTLAIGFAFLAVFAVVMTLARRQEERDANRIAAMYGIGLGLVAVSEFMMYIDLAFGASIATYFAMSTGVVIFFAIAAAVIAIGALAVAVALQYREESSYRTTHSFAH